MGIIPILQTPSMQDINVKRTREESYSSGMDTTTDRFEINYRKNPKLNPVTEQ